MVEVEILATLLVSEVTSHSLAGNLDKLGNRKQVQRNGAVCGAGGEQSAIRTEIDAMDEEAAAT